MTTLENLLRGRRNVADDAARASERAVAAARALGLTDVSYSFEPSPVGDLLVAVTPRGLIRIAYNAEENGDDVLAELARRVSPRVVEAPAALDSVRRELDEYFAGERTTFDLPLADVGGSEFDRAVWAALGTIPYGEMRTYGQIAAAVGDPTAARAVGVACNRNRLAIVLPCHRVVGADGKLVGFGGGLPNKRFLLELEARVRIEHDFAF
jgi:methylated-DNA-[protein]-cysteine S-methyltransferase